MITAIIRQNKMLFFRRYSSLASKLRRLPTLHLTPEGLKSHYACTASASRLFSKMSGTTAVLSANADTTATCVRSDISSFGETTVAAILESKGDDKGAGLWCTTKDSVLAAIKKMSMANVGSLIVLDDSQASANANAAAIRGIFTERDYLKKIVLEGRSSPETGVIDIMTPQEMIKTIEPSTSVMEAMDIMVEKQIRHLPVIEDGKLISALVTEHKRSMEMMSSYINGSY